MKELNCLVFLSCVSVLTVSEQSDVIGSHEPVHVTVGHDVILPCHLVPPFDVTTLTVEWKWNESIIHVYRHRKDYLEDQNKNFRGRTSLFLNELVKGNISLKLINVTEQDAGKYTCFVQKLDSQVRNGSIILIVESEENRNKGKTDSDKKTEENNNNNNDGLYGLFALILVAAIVATVATVVTVIRRKHVKNNPGAERYRRGQHEQAETDDSSDEGQESGAGPDGRGQHEQVETNDSRDEGQESGAGPDGRGQHEQVETNDSRDEGQESGAGPDGRGQHEQVETNDSRDEGPKSGAGPDRRGQYEQVEMVEMVDSRDEWRMRQERTRLKH